MKKIFTDESLQKAFESTIEMYESFRSIVSKKVDCSNPSEIINHMTELTSVLATGVSAKAQFQMLTEKLSFQKTMNFNNDNMGATERKIIIAYEIGDCSFWNGLCEMLIKECHYKIEILRSALSFCKQEFNNI